MEDESKEIEEKFESSKKRVRDEKGKQEWVGGALLGANSEFNGQTTSWVELGTLSET